MSHLSRRALRAGLFACTTFVSIPAMADEADPVAVVHGTTLDDLSTGSTLSQEELRRRASAASDTAQVLSALPGVSASTGGGFSAMPMVRGLSEQRLSILVDGQIVDMACPNDMNTPLSYTNPQTLASITVVPGVAPVSMGGDNIGGVIAVEGASPRFSTDDSLLVTGSASSYYRSNGDGFGGAVSLTMASRNLSATYTGAYTQSDNYKAGGDRGAVRSTEYAKTDHALALALKTEAGLWELKGGYHYSPREGFPNQWMDMVDNRSWFAQGRYRGDFDWGKVDLSAGWRDTDHKMDFLADKQPGSMPMNTQVHSFDAAAKFEVPVGEHNLVRSGLEYHHQWLNDYWPPVEGSMMMGPDAFVNVNAAHRNRIGAFGEWESHLATNLSATLGLRYDRVEMDTGDVAPYGTSMMQAADVAAAAAFNAIDRAHTDDNWSGSALLTWNASSLVTLELGYAHKTRSPNIYERYSWGRGTMASQMIGWYGDGNGYVGNPDLKPEQADTVSAAIALAPMAGVNLKVSPYYTRVDDYIDAVFVQNLSDMMGMPSGFVQMQFANIDAEFYGVDVSADALLQGTRENGTTLSATLEWVHAQNLTDDLPVYRQMPLNASVALAHRSGALELGAQVEWVDAKTRVDTRRNEPRTDAYALVGLSAAYTLAGWRLGVEAENLLDKAYDLPLGGMSLGDYGVTGDLNTVSGRGRSINVSLSTRF